MERKTRRGIAIFAATSVSAFWINAAGHAWMRQRGNPLVREFKGTLEYRSAIAGDAAFMPLINVLLDRQLDAWDEGLRAGQVRPRRLAGAVGLGLAITAAFHIFQGAQKLTNWTMPRPWRWTFFGYYHAVYMAAQSIFLAYFCAALALRWRAGGAGAALTRRFLAAAALLGAWAVLLYKDYY